MNSTHGALTSANSQSALTLAAPSPANISMKSEPDVLMNGTSASPAIALANIVLPVPGGPSSIIPRVGTAPILANCLLFFICSTANITSSLLSVIPATSSNDTISSGFNTLNIVDDPITSVLLK